MKRKVLAILVPALLAAGAANAAEIYNKNGNKLDFYGKMVGEHIMTHDGDNDNSDDTSYARFGIKGENAEAWSLATKYDANNVYASVMYGESQNMTHMEKGGFANKTQNIEAVVQYQFDFGLRPSLGYVYAKGKDLNGNRDADIMNYVELGTWYYFNKNFNVYTAYKFNLVDDEDSAITGASTDDQFAVGITYQF